MKVLCNNGQFRDVPINDIIQNISDTINRTNIPKESIGGRIKVVWEFPSGNSISQRLHVTQDNGSIMIDDLDVLFIKYSEQMKNYRHWYIGDFMISYDNEFFIVIRTYTSSTMIYRF